MKLYFIIYFVGFSLVAVDCSVKNEVECGLAYPDCTFFVNSQTCETDYCSSMTEGMCLHGYPGCFWDNGCRTDPCVYWSPFDDTSNPCNETYCQWKEYHNVKFDVSTGEPQFVESYQCVNKTQERDNPYYLLGPAVFNPPNEYYCEYFPECELAVVLDPVYGAYEMCDPKMDKECDELGIDNCYSESPSCFLNSGNCVLDTCLQYSNSFCPAGCVKKGFHDMILADGKAYYSEITQCINSSAPDDYNVCYLIKPGYCDHYDDCEEKTVSHVDHGHIICSSKAKGSKEENDNPSKSDPDSNKANATIIVLLVVVIVIVVVAVVVISALLVWRTKSKKEGQVVAVRNEEMSESHRTRESHSKLTEDASEIAAESE